MKKVILSAFALMIGAVGFSQVSSTSTPSQVNPQTAVDQRINGGNGNLGEAIQNGNDNKVRVRQAGVNNSVYTNQSDGDLAGGNLADVIQTGAVNGNVGNSGQDNIAETRQTGEANQSSTRQQGDRNDAQTLQGQNNASSKGNLASIQQGTNNNAEDNDAMIQQDGEENEAKTLQRWDNNSAFTIQNGDNNESFVDQASNPENSAGHYGYNEQNGDGNWSVIRQSGSADQEAYTLQEGDNNKALQIQNSNGASAGAGDGNTALVNQGVETEYGTVRAQYGPILKNNVDDWTEGGSNGDGSFGAKAYQLQTGLSNNAEIHQYGQVDEDANNNEAGQEQHGDDNQALIVQNAYGNPNGGNNYAYQIQSLGSSGNVAALAQNGRGHKAYQEQNGTDSEVLSTQRGRDNKLSTYQSDANNYIETAQRGVDNTILITQDNNGNSFVANQNLPNGVPVGVPNSNNQIDVYQTGPGTDQFGGVNPNDCDFSNEVLMEDPMSPDAPTNYDICPDC